MLFPGLYIAMAVFMMFYPQKIERLLAQKIVLGCMILVFLVIVSIFVEAAMLGWFVDRFFLLLASVWFVFCGLLVVLPILKLQRWIGQDGIFFLRSNSNLKLFGSVLMILGALAMILALFA